MVFFIVVQEVGLLSGLLCLFCSSFSVTFGIARDLVRDVFASIDPDSDAQVKFGAAHEDEIVVGWLGHPIFRDK